MPSGICALNNGTIENCLNMGGICDAYNSVGITSSNDYNAKVINCYNDSNVYNGELVSGFLNNCSAANKTTEELSGGDLPEGFNSSIWTVGSVGGDKCCKRQIR